jgi:hypothetical protein
MCVILLICVVYCLANICICAVGQISEEKCVNTRCWLGWQYVILYAWCLAVQAGMHGKIHEAALMFVDFACHIHRPVTNCWTVFCCSLSINSYNVCHTGDDCHTGQAASAVTCQQMLSRLLCSLCLWLLQTIMSQNIDINCYQLEAFYNFTSQLQMFTFITQCKHAVSSFGPLQSMEFLSDPLICNSWPQPNVIHLPFDSIKMVIKI